MLFLGICSFLAISCTSDKDGKDFVKCVLKQGILERAAMNIKEEPVTVTAFIAERSAGDIHDFYSEGDYWWPDTLNPDGPYVRRDGETNPDNFVAHRHAMIRFSSIVGNLTSANINRKRIHTCCSYQSNAHDIEMLFKKRDSAD